MFHYEISESEPRINSAHRVTMRSRIIPHQANLRASEPLAEQLRLTSATVSTGIQESANPSATITHRSGAPLLLYGIGGGLSHAALVAAAPKAKECGTCPSNDTPSSDSSHGCTRDNLHVSGGEPEVRAAPRITRAVLLLTGRRSQHELHLRRFPGPALSPSPRSYRARSMSNCIAKAFTVMPCSRFVRLAPTSSPVRRVDGRVFDSIGRADQRAVIATVRLGVPRIP